MMGQTQACTTALAALSALPQPNGCAGGPPEPNCDPAENTGCSACQKCVKQSGKKACVAAGNNSLGQPCTITGTADDCAEGLCAAAGTADSDWSAQPPKRLCQRACSSDTDCSGGQRCAAATTSTQSSSPIADNNSIGICVSPCTGPATCAVGQTCGAAYEAFGTGAPFRGCRKLGSVAVGDTCAQDTECVADAYCAANACAPICGELTPCGLGGQGCLLGDLPRCGGVINGTYLHDCGLLVAGELGATINITAGGFSPSTPTLSPPSSIAVKFVNMDSVPRGVASGTVGNFDGSFTTGAMPPGAEACVILGLSGSTVDFYDPVGKSATGKVSRP